MVYGYRLEGRWWVAPDGTRLRAISGGFGGGSGGGSSNIPPPPGPTPQQTQVEQQLADEMRQSIEEQRLLESALRAEFGSVPVGEATTRTGVPTVVEPPGAPTAPTAPAATPATAAPRVGSVPFFPGQQPAWISPEQEPTNLRVPGQLLWGPGFIAPSAGPGAGGPLAAGLDAGATGGTLTPEAAIAQQVLSDYLLSNQLRQRQQAALRGDLPADPGLIKQWQDAEQVLRQTLHRQLGPGYESSSAGQYALQQFNQARQAAFFGANQQFIYNPGAIPGYTGQVGGAIGGEITPANPPQSGPLLAALQAQAVLGNQYNLGLLGYTAAGQQAQAMAGGQALSGLLGGAGYFGGQYLAGGGTLGGLFGGGGAGALYSGAFGAGGALAPATYGGIWTGAGLTGAEAAGLGAAGAGAGAAGAGVTAAELAPLLLAI